MSHSHLCRYSCPKCDFLTCRFRDVNSRFEVAADQALREGKAANDGVLSAA